MDRANGPRCAICAKTVAPPEENKAFPLCSPRCRAIDLGRWLTESYRIPAEPVELESSGEGSGSLSKEDDHP